MSDFIKHECGIAMIRLRKPLEYYFEKHGTPTYAINKLYLLMQKQHNRGQDGAGMLNIKLDHPPGNHYMTRYRSVESQPIMDLFEKVNKKLGKLKEERPKKYYNAKWMKKNAPFVGELYMGHLRYGTHGKNEIRNCHPMIRRNNWKSRNLIMAGNFNMTNVDELFSHLVDLGQHPIEKIDTVTVLEKIGHFLDEENQRLFSQYKEKGLSNEEITDRISEDLDIQAILKRSCKDFDGGYAMLGMIGFGAAFVARDPAGIRPAYYYVDDDVVVAASEKPAIKTTFDIEYDEIKEVPPGHALIVKKNGDVEVKEFIKPLEQLSCSFERIYFSRGSDPEIYKERKRLGEILVNDILKEVDYDLKNTVFSYIPNTAETAFMGMERGLDKYLTRVRQDAYNEKDRERLADLLKTKIRVEKLVIKDVKLRTFITDSDQRDDLVGHVYDTTYELLQKRQDTIVVIDDSIVRGTTLEKSIINMLERLKPKRIVVVSSAPQIRYPDCYGIDMSTMSHFVAFRAMLNLLEKTGKENLLEEVKKKCEKAFEKGIAHKKNYLKELYDQFTDQQISDEIAEIVKPDYVKADVKVIYQSVDNLHKACPNHLGDWYFTGNYPTDGGNKVVNRAFINFMEGHTGRAY
ncbi:amidophosphoribosyltransferase [Flammeovirgaceae bacterium SG7u.111]|nr:amidophosphoribosyltransferase [Flammeovirgaceae bacterium SG7u.132]WPO35415.1 amidophosphoribosyltransferase [Flammeovirgaceae bacterium SG7u.111]